MEQLNSSSASASASFQDEMPLAPVAVTMPESPRTREGETTTHSHINNNINTTLPEPPLLSPTCTLHLLSSSTAPIIPITSISSPPPPAASNRHTPAHTPAPRHQKEAPHPHAQATTTHTSLKRTAESRPTAKLPTSASSAPRKKNPASGARACNLLGAGANHLGAPHTHAQRASRPTDPGERAKRRRRARLMPSNVSGLPLARHEISHPVRLAYPSVVCCTVP